MIVRNVLALSCYLSLALAITRSFSQFDNFFPQWQPELTGYLDHECKDQIATYRNRTNLRPQAGYAVLDCILNTMPEFRKAELSAAAVFLGLIPATLQLLSPSWADTGVLSFRRPLISLLLAASSSAVSPITAANVDDYMARLTTDSFPQAQLSGQGWLTFAVSVTEYVFAAAAVVNNFHLAYQLGVLAVCTFVPAYTFLPAIWVCSAILIHLVGWAAMRLRLRIRDGGRQIGLRGMIMSEVGTAAVKRDTLRLWEQKEGFCYLGLVTALYVGSALQILYGTAILSSLVFLSVRDAIIVALRYMASTLVGRGILIFELNGLRGIKMGSKERMYSEVRDDATVVPEVYPYPYAK